MGRSEITNLVAWGGTTLCVGFFIGPRGSLVLVAGVALGIAMFTRFWAESLGVAAGVTAVFLLDAVTKPVSLLPGVAIGAAAVAIWRWRQSLPEERSAPRRPAATRPRLIVSVVLAALALFVLDLGLALGFGLARCEGDTGRATPGSDRAAWCDTLASHDLWAFLVFAPAALVLLGGLYFSSRGRAREVLMTLVAGFVLAVGVHIPDFVLSNAAP